MNNKDSKNVFTPFESLVLEMRRAQREYFRTRSHEVLQRSKALEKKVDHLLEQKHLNETFTQQDLI